MFTCLQPPFDEQEAYQCKCEVEYENQIRCFFLGREIRILKCVKHGFRVAFGLGNSHIEVLNSINTRKRDLQ